ncbi:MAG: hypothetical protein PHY46_00470 [Candidatus Omnitrophica bacterium]|nr:hypothetical protein [Candidatus Omnitrophota bacterium]MDD5356101.1 hypothetical protein [Candidatus Omnitrophota bacterium]
MRKPLILPLAIIVVIFMVSFVCMSSAQGQEETMDYSWGVVKSISPDQITVTEQDEDTGQEQDVVYNIDSGVAINNTYKIEDIVVGNSIGVEYEIKDGNKVAKVIDVEEGFQQEDDTQNSKTCE